MGFKAAIGPLRRLNHSSKSKVKGKKRRNGTLQTRLLVKYSAKLGTKISSRSPTAVCYTTTDPLSRWKIRVAGIL